MSDSFYDLVHTVGSMIFWATSRPTVLHEERTALKGPYILASSHHSPLDTPLLIRHSRRYLDFVSIVEVFAKRFSAWFYGSMNAFPLDRSKPDAPTIRIILSRLKRGRVIAMFPEGACRKPENSVTHGGAMRPGVGRLAVMAGVPIVPAVVINSIAYTKISAWIPHHMTRYGIIFGKPIYPDSKLGKSAAVIEDRLKEAFMQLYQELARKMSK